MNRRQERKKKRRERKVKEKLEAKRIAARARSKEQEKQAASDAAIDKAARDLVNSLAQPEEVVIKSPNVSEGKQADFDRSKWSKHVLDQEERNEGCS